MGRRGSRPYRLRFATDNHFIAEVADDLVVDHEFGAVFAQLGFADGEHGPVIEVRRMQGDDQTGEVRFIAAFVLKLSCQARKASSPRGMNPSLCICCLFLSVYTIV